MASRSTRPGCSGEAENGANNFDMYHEDLGGDVHDGNPGEELDWFREGDTRGGTGSTPTAGASIAYLPPAGSSITSAIGLATAATAVAFTIASNAASIVASAVVSAVVSAVAPSPPP